MTSARSKRYLEKRLLRRKRAVALESSYQRLRGAIYQAAVFTAGAVPVSMGLELLGFASAAGLTSDALQQPMLRYYAVLLGTIGTAYFGSIFAFRFLSKPQPMSPERLLLLGAAFGLTSYFSFIPALWFAGVPGSVVWLLLLAVAISLAGTLLPSKFRQ